MTERVLHWEQFETTAIRFHEHLTLQTFSVLRHQLECQGFMVSLDDKAFLLTFIRNSFVTGDDTGVCELLCPRERITTDELDMIVSGNHCVFPPENDGRVSPEIPINYENVSRRQSAAESRYMQSKKEEERRKQIKRTVMQTDQCKVLTLEEIDDLFPLSEPTSGTPQSRPTSGRPLSALSLLLAESEAKSNPFADFAIHDGCTTCPGEENARAIAPRRVYLWDLDPQKRNLPVVVTPLRNTTIAQFIGLVAWKYTEEGREPGLTSDIVEESELYMFDDEDDLNSDFAPLCRKDDVYKYEFPKLALLRRQKAAAPNAASSAPGDEKMLVRIKLAQGTSSQRFAPSTQLREVLAETIRRRMLKQHAGGYEYRLECGGRPVNLESRLDELHATEFDLVRENSRPAKTSDSALSNTQQKVTEVLDSLELQQYRVSMKGVIKKDVLFSVSGEKIEIEQLSKSTFSLSRQKPHQRVPIEAIAECRMLPQASGPRCVFKLVHASGPRGGSPPRDRLSTAQFEAPRAVVEAICRQVTNILEYRGAGDALAPRPKALPSQS